MDLCRNCRTPWAAVATVALAAVLNPLNTSMIAVALPELGRIFGVSAGFINQLAIGLRGRFRCGAPARRAAC